MSTKKQVYAEEYLAAHNRALKGHPKYRNDMKYSQVLATGALVMNTRDKELTPEDAQVFEEVCKTVDKNYKLIIYEAPMSLSKECQEYHLTPRGWIEGSFKGDVIGGSKEVPTPADRVLTIACYDEIPSAFAKSYFHDQIVWQSEDKRLIEQLKVNWGERPNWFGYRK